MPKPVYLVGTEDIKTVVDGPSLWIERPGKAGQRIPFRLISRVHFIGDITISSEVILALAENAIPLVVSGLTGDAKAILIPFNHRLPKFHKFQRVILESKSNMEKYINWAVTYRKYFQLKFLKNFFPLLRQANDIGDGDYKEYLGRLTSTDNVRWQLVKKIVHTLHQGLICEQLKKSGLDPHPGVLFRRVNFGFLLDMSFILEARVDEQTVMFFKQKNHQKYFEYLPSVKKLIIKKEGYRDVVNRFENKREETKIVIDRVIDDFFVLIRELNS